MLDEIPLAQLNYAPAAERSLLRPLLWLIFVMPAAQVIGELSREAVFVVAMVTRSGSTSGTSDMANLAGGMLGVSVSVWVMVTAWLALRSRRLESLRIACGAMAGLLLVTALLLILLAWSRLIGNTALPPGYRWQFVVTSVGRAVGGAVMPLTACLILGKIRRETPNF